MSTPPIIGVTGGAAGLAATHAAVRALADGYDTAASRMRGWAWLGARTLADPDLAGSALLSPLTFAEAEHAVLAAITGRDGILAQSCCWEADAVAVRAALSALEAADVLAEAAVDDLDRRLGLAAGFALRASAPVLVPAAVVVADEVPESVRDRVGDDLQQWVVDHPGVVQQAVNGGGGLLLGLTAGSALTPDAASGARLLGGLYDDGTGRATLRTDLGVASQEVPPSDLSGLVGHLQEVAGLSGRPDSPDNGTIEIQTLDAGTDHVRHIVYLPGTDDMTTLPWTQDGDVRDMGTNLRLEGGQDNAYQQGILDAMRQAHIGAHEPVLLVGHSQGGMEAAAILGHGSGYDVTHVVTAGSPTAQVHHFPAGSHVLSLEQRGDVVPLLDGAPNPDSVQQTTVTFDDHATGILDAHGYGHYVAGAAAADASTDPSVVEQLASLRDHGFLAPTTAGALPPTVSSHIFQVVRQH